MLVDNDNGHGTVRLMRMGQGDPEEGIDIPFFGGHLMNKFFDDPHQNRMGTWFRV
jgi:hypothetical protein